MKIHSIRNRTRAGFTLIEMIGVLAVIAILAAVLIPKVFEAINNSRVNNTAMTCNTAKTAIADHYAKYGSLLSSNGITIATTDLGAMEFDKTLLKEGFLDKPFEVKISASGVLTNHVEIVPAALAGTPPASGNAAYALSGDVTVNEATGSAVVQAVIPGVTQADAKDLNDRLDGPTLGENLGTTDLKGRVKFIGTTPTTTVYVYLTHR